jgi:hypothetical protein
MGRRDRSDGLFDPELTIETTHRRLVASGVLEPLELGGTDELEWADCELASLAENRLGERLDLDTGPRALDPDRRARWRSEATTERFVRPSTRHLERCYWLLEQGRRVGTVALGTSTLGGERLRLSSLYLSPQNRGRGTARRALACIRDFLGEHERGVRLETEWTWQAALGFYLRAGMWVRMWKRDLELWAQAGLPAPAIEIGGDRAELTAEIGGERIVLVRAARDGQRLASFEDAFRGAEPPEAGLAPIAWDASTTLAVALAVRGWPLLADPETWKRGWHGDAGNPEGLADRIVCWEAWAHHHGWRVDTPRIPGLAYPTWLELEAEWA